MIISCGDNLQTISAEQLVLLRGSHLSLKALCGLLHQPRWGIGGRQEIVERLNSGQITAGILKFCNLVLGNLRLVQEHDKTGAELWGGIDLKCTFRICVDDRLFQLWLEIKQLASTINFSDEEDVLIWQFTSTGVYSPHSPYKVISFRGVIPVYVPTMWNLKVPPSIHFFCGFCLRINC